MFTLITKKLGEEDIIIQLRYQDNHVSFVLDPEAPEQICETVIDEKNGQFATGGCNGEFFLDWSGSHVEVCVAKYGDGAGGSLLVEVNKSPEVMASLMKALTEWKALFEESPK